MEVWLETHKGRRVLECTDVLTRLSAGLDSSERTEHFLTEWLHVSLLFIVIACVPSLTV